ncbi:MAG: ABC transporter ATP-binding protein [Deinococcota bacterium]
MSENGHILNVCDLKTHFQLEEGVLKAVDGVDLVVPQQKIVGVIGESGSGKSVMARSIMRLISKPGKIVAGKILLAPDDSPEVDIAQLDNSGSSIRSIRGKVISMIFQEPMTSLSPVHTVGSQIVEAILLHRTSNKSDAKSIALDMIERVGIANPKQRFNEYPHQLSGGMRQRVMIAMALSCNPSVLIADEPTTALDVTVQAQILELLQELQAQYGMAIIFITHNLGVIAEIADEVNVMYLGRIVEHGTTRQVFKHPQHPYTQKLLASLPKMGRGRGTRLDAIDGNVPVPINFPAQCGFYSRCKLAIQGRCDVAVPELHQLGAGHVVRCILAQDATATQGTISSQSVTTNEAVASEEVLHA